MCLHACNHLSQMFKTTEGWGIKKKEKDKNSLCSWVLHSPPRLASVKPQHPVHTWRHQSKNAQQRVTFQQLHTLITTMRTNSIFRHCWSSRFDLDSEKQKYFVYPVLGSLLCCSWKVSRANMDAWICSGAWWMDLKQDCECLLTLKQKKW